MLYIQGKMSNWALCKFHKWVWRWPWTFKSQATIMPILSYSVLELQPWTPLRVQPQTLVSQPSTKHCAQRTKVTQASIPSG